MLTKTIKIDDKEVLFAASAAIPRIYRIQFRRDIFQDMAKIEKSVKNHRISRLKRRCPSRTSLSRI